MLRSLVGSEMCIRDSLITVAAGTPAGTYTVEYEICENNNPTNCATVTETVTVEAPAIDALPETFAPINGADGGVTSSVLASDTHLTVLQLTQLISQSLRLHLVIQT